jgi:hypothetical protein
MDQAIENSAPKQLKAIASGHLTPDLSQYAQGNSSSHHQKKNLRA